VGETDDAPAEDVAASTESAEARSVFAAPTDDDPTESPDTDPASESPLTPSRSESPTAPLVVARNVVKEYQTGDETLRALKGVDLTIHPGEFVAVVGPSGSGKSTLLNVLGLLDVPTHGTVELDGTDVASLSIAERTRLRRETVGFVFQSFHLLPTLTATENVMLPRLAGRDTSGAFDRADRLLRSVGLADRTDHYPDQLSGGQRQRVAVARSLVNDPRLLLADEPTGNLDQATGRQVLDEFAAIADEGVAIVAVTHDEQVTRFADRVVTIVDGRIDFAADEDGADTTESADGPPEGAEP
jgi:putative ABC transport system ATP-binding protein